MLAFDNGVKRSSQTMDEIEPSKKRKVEFADSVTILSSNSEDTKDNNEFTVDMYKRVVLSALNDLDKVCYFFVLLF